MEESDFFRAYVATVTSVQTLFHGVASRILTCIVEGLVCSVSCLEWRHEAVKKYIFSVRLLMFSKFGYLHVELSESERLSFSSLNINPFRV